MHEVYWFKKLIKEMNISTLIFLKLYDQELCANVKSKASSKNTPYPIHYLCYKYGLKKAYISKSHKLLVLDFNPEKVLDDLNLTDKEYYNILDLFIDSDFFQSIETREDSILIKLFIPKQYRSDIELFVKESKYSLLSQTFKNAMKPISDTIPIIENSLARYIVLKNIPLNIVLKGSKLRETIRKTYGVSVEHTLELFVNFDPKKEYYEENF